MEDFTKKELKDRLAQLSKEHELKKRETIRAYCDANNPYKVGDKFTDHIGTILIEKIEYNYDCSFDGPCCVFTGVALRKDGLPKKNGSYRGAWQSNQIERFSTFVA